MVIELVEQNEMRTGRGGGGGKGAGKYSKYRLAIQKIVPFLKESIEANGTIRAKTEDIKKEMGGEFAKRHGTSIYWGLKYSLFHEGIWVTTGKHNDGSEVLVMRDATPEDKLPDSLLKGSEGDEGGEKDLPDIDTDKDITDDENGEEDK
jgi:hypothetical protein